MGRRVLRLATSFTEALLDLRFLGEGSGVWAEVVRFHARIADAHRQRTIEPAGEVYHGGRTHLEHLDLLSADLFFIHDRVRAGRRADRFRLELGSGDRVGAKDVDGFFLEGDGCDLALVVGGAGGDPVEPPLARAHFERQRPGVAADERFLMGIDGPGRLDRGPGRGLDHAPLRAGRVLAPALGAASVACRGLGRSLRIVLPLENPGARELLSRCA